ncbi:TPA_exp: D-tyrosyl-tRNA(Tyr) deacylase [Trichophyton benhamiae CBS 112371]|nr:TPA_exp: D-tyrosyl-tRNA(Tyr) deacylase [Trichophyton benhamiae CBS 112371]
MKPGQMYLSSSHVPPDRIYNNSSADIALFGYFQWKKNVQDIQGEVLCVSQFTLLATLKKGNKPDFHKAADPKTARELYEYFHSKVQNLYTAERVKDGVFQAMMEVGLVNDGPVTLEIDTNPAKKEDNASASASASASTS